MMMMLLLWEKEQRQDESLKGIDDVGMHSEDDELFQRIWEFQVFVIAMMMMRKMIEGVKE